MKKKAILFIVFLTIFLIIFFILVDKLNIQKSTDNFVNELNETNIKYSSLFKIDKIVLFSSADAISNNNQRPLWDLNIYQYTNIGLYLSYDNIPVKRIYLNNFDSPNFYYKLPEDFGNGKFKEEDVVNNSIDFETTPITLIHINKDLIKNYIVSNTTELLFDGSLLKKAGIKLEDIDSEISFDINIITENNEHFVCNFYLDIILEKSNDESIYNGYIVDTIEHPDYLFKKI